MEQEGKKETGGKAREGKINFEKVIEAKAPKLKKWIPGFVLRYLKKILHEDEINYVFSLYGDLWGKDFADALIGKYFNIRFNFVGTENLPADGRVIFACNHPLGGIDGVALIQALTAQYSDMKVPVNDFLMYVDNLREFFIPINKMGGQSKSATVMMNEVCASDSAILFFPAGQCSRRQKDGKIKDNDWKKTFVTKSVKYKRDIVPLYFEGENSSFFYNLAYYRKKLGIKANIEMLFLIDEFFKQKNKTFTVKIGQPIPYSTFDGSKSETEWAAWVKNITYSL